MQLTRSYSYPVTLVNDRWPWVGSLGLTAMGLLKATTLLAGYPLKG